MAKKSSKKKIPELSQKEKEKNRKELERKIIDAYKESFLEGIYPSAKDICKKFGISERVIYNSGNGGSAVFAKRAVKELGNKLKYKVSYHPNPNIRYKKEDVLLMYAEAYKEHGKSVSRKLLAQINRKLNIDLHYYFSGTIEAEMMARKAYPNLFDDIQMGMLSKDVESIEKLRVAVERNKNFVITTAVTGCPVNVKFYQGLKRFCKEHNTVLLIMVCSDPAKDKETANKQGTIDNILSEEVIVIEDTSLNSNLHLSTIKMSAKQISPLSGLGRIKKEKGSLIFASPKFFLDYVSAKNSKKSLPHGIMTTGAITNPSYNSDMYMSLRTAYIAEYDHRLGALFVQIKDNDVFHVKQLEVKCEDSSFCYLNKRYYSNKTVKERPEAIVLPDIHADITCPISKDVWTRIIKETKPKKVFLHDLLNGTSINHWIENDIIEKSLITKLGRDDLTKELDGVCDEINHYLKICEEVYIVPSNHNMWLDRWLRAAKYAKDPKNHYIGLILAKALFEGHNPLQYYYEVIKQNKNKKVIWPEMNDDIFIGNVQLNCHGHKGVNGSKGTIKGMETAYVESISGHSHSAGILRNAWKVGTSTELDEGYNAGPGTWTKTACLVYSYGERTLINDVFGEWKE